jgi:hypothetical protein
MHTPSDPWERIGAKRSAKSRVTASGFTESDSETVSAFPRTLTGKELKERLRLATEVSGLMKQLELTPEQILYCDDLVHRFSNKNADQDERHVQIEDMRMIKELSRMSSDAVSRMADEIKSNASDAMAGFRKMFTRNWNKEFKVKETLKSVDESDDETIAPLQTRSIMANDSVSNVGKLKFDLKPSIRDVQSDLAATSVIGGYSNVFNALDELDDIDITPINGLPKVFVNDRLNFLCHLHKPLKLLLSDGEIYPTRDIIVKFDNFVKKHKGREREPENNLLYLVIRKTISMSRLQVRGNPFNLPLLEPGMYIDEKMIFMCIDQLYNEFCSQWFNTLKAVDIPDFHSRYNMNFSPQRRVRTDPVKRRATRSVLGI